MRRLRWTEDACDDLVQIADHLFDQAEAQAAKLSLRIYEAPLGLLQFPYRGRVGRKPDTRELVSLAYLTSWFIAGPRI